MPIAPTPPYPPTNALVAVAWLSQRVAELDAAMVATRLPRDPATWADAGFVQATVVGGTPDIDVPIRRPVVQIDAWAVTYSDGTISQKPPVGKANRLAEAIRLATESPQAFGQAVMLPTNYAGARVLSVYPISEPSEIEDPAGYARLTMDLVFEWTRA